MSEETNPRERYVPVWGIFLLFTGIILLLQNFGVLSWALWTTLWRFWPMLLVMLGLSILMRRFNVWLVSLLMAVLLLICLSIAILQTTSDAGPAVNDTGPTALTQFSSIT